MRENEWCTLTLDTKLGLVISEKMTEINVKQVAQHGDHDVVIVTITNSKNITLQKQRSIWEKRGGKKITKLTLQHNTQHSIKQSYPGTCSSAPHSANFET